MKVPFEVSVGETSGEARRKISLSSNTAALIRDVIGRSKALRAPTGINCVSVPDFFTSSLPYEIGLVSVPLLIRGERGKMVRGRRRSRVKPFPLQLRKFDFFQICVLDGNGVEEIERWCGFVIEKCLAAVAQSTSGENGVKFLLLNELGFPTFSTNGPPGSRNGVVRRQLEAARYHLQESLQKIATDAGVVIIAGSAHDPQTFSNWGPIFFPDRDLFFDHYKLTSAHRSEEHIVVPTDKGYPIYDVGDLRFSVLICSDVLDLNIFFETFAGTRSSRRLVPDIIFVPSFYNPTTSDGDRHALRRACRQLSEAVDAVIVFCNYAGDAEAHAVFVGGVAISLRAIDTVSIARLDATELAQYRADASPVWAEMRDLLSRPLGSSFSSP